jgi:hypothetical protein
VNSFFPKEEFWEEARGIAEIKLEDDASLAV